MLLSGFLSDYTGDYDMTFLVAGALIFVSGFMLILIPCLARRDDASNYHLNTQQLNVDEVTVTDVRAGHTTPNGTAHIAATSPARTKSAVNGEVTRNANDLVVPTINVDACVSSTHA